MLARYNEDNDAELARKFCAICAGNVNVISLPDAFDQQLVLSIKKELDSSGRDVGSLTPTELRKRMADKVQTLFGYKDAAGTFAASMNSGEKANRYLLWQIYSLIAGVLLFFAWHMIRIIELNHIAQQVVT
ncbi:hypothetical protein, partial [Aeromonas aquatica]|uniref:hypothetical protein n=1 Tax=Aeromonas aquatica TaxID=558964 RepID=UPI00126A7A63